MTRPVVAPVLAPVLAVVLAVVVSVVAACGEDKPPAAPVPAANGANDHAVAPAAPRPVRRLPIFVDVARAAGITAMNHTGKPAQKDWIVSGMGGGAIVLDYDQDGWMDLVVVDGMMLTEEGELEKSEDARTRLYHNDGDMHFTDVSRKSGVDMQAFGFGGASCDYDADGWPDFYVCCWGRNYLMHNRGDSTFEDVAEKAGVVGAEDDMSTACCWGDVDGDGIPDLYVSNYSDQRDFIKHQREKGEPGRISKYRQLSVYYGPGGLTGQVDRLYLGNGNGTFREVTSTNLGPQDPGGKYPGRYGFQPIMTDVDNDGHLDIYVANDTQPNYLWLNDGHGKFNNVAVEAGVAADANSRDQASMGVDAADVNHNGLIDLVVTNFSHDHNTLYVNRTQKGVVSFRDLSDLYNLTAPSFLRLSWGTRLFDYDNDGELDLFVACGHVYGEIDKFRQATSTTYRQKCLLMHNVGPPSYAFEDVTENGGPALELERVWRGAAFADFDNDGDLDVFVSALNDFPALFRNDGGNENSFLVFRLVAKNGLRDPAGARVTVFVKEVGLPHMEELHHGASFCSDNDPRLFFGLGSEASAKRVEVLWPGGDKQVFENVAARKFYVLKQGGQLTEDKPTR